MKLHLPIGLRKAVYAIFATVPSAALAMTFASATVQAGDCVLSKDTNLTASVDGDTTYDNVMVTPGAPEVTIQFGYTYDGGETKWYASEAEAQAAADKFVNDSAYKAAYDALYQDEYDAAFTDYCKTEAYKSIYAESLNNENKVTYNATYTATYYLNLWRGAQKAAEIATEAANAAVAAAKSTNEKIAKGVADGAAALDADNKAIKYVKDNTGNYTQQFEDKITIVDGSTSIPDDLSNDYALTVNNGDLTSTGKLSTPEGIKGTLTVTATDGNMNLNDVEGANIHLTAGKDVTIAGNATMTNGSINGKTVVFNSGDVNNLGTLNLIASSVNADSVSITAKEVKLGAVLDFDLLSILAGKAITPTTIEAANDITIATNGGNTILGATINATNGTVTMGGENAVNAMLGVEISGVGLPATVNGKGNVTVTGGLNTLIGTAELTSTEGNITLKGAGKMTSEALAPLMGELGALVGSLGGEESELGGWLNGKIDELLAGADSYLQPLEKIGANANMMLGGSVTANSGNVTLNSTVNMLLGTTVQAANGTATLSGALNAMMSGSVNANDIVVNYNNSGIDISNVITSILGSNAGQLTGMLDSLGTVEGSINIVTGGSLTATQTVTMNGAINLLTGGTVSGNLVQLNGPINAVAGGKVTGSVIELNGSDEANLGDLLGGIFNAGGSSSDMLGGFGSFFEGLEGNLNVVMGGSVGVADTQSVSLNGTTNLVIGGMVNAGTTTMTGTLNVVASSGNVSGTTVNLDGPVNLVVAGGTVTGSTITLQNTTDDKYSIGGLISDMLPTGTPEIIGSALTAVQGNLNIVTGANATVGNEDTQAVTMKGAINVVSDGATVTGGAITMTGSGANGLTLGGLVPEALSSVVSLPALDGLLNSELHANLVMDGANVTAANTVNMGALVNLVAGGSTVHAGESVSLNGGLNLVVDTTSENLQNALLTGSVDSLATGGTVTTTVSSAQDVNLTGTINMVNGKVALNAGNAVNLNGTANWVSGISNVQGNAAVNMDATANVVAGGATVNAGVVDENGDVVGNITMTGGLNAVVDTTLSNVVDALKNQSIDSLMQGGNQDTTLSATGNINLGAVLNVVNGGQVTVNAGNAVNFEGVANVVSGNATVNGTDITMSGKALGGVNLGAVLPEQLADFAQKLGVTDMLNEGVNANVVAGGANLNATNNIEMSGMVSAVVDTTLTNVVDAVQQQSIDPLLKGGVSETYVFAENDVNLNSQINVVNGGMVKVEAGNDVNMNGSLNYVGGDAQVTADKKVNMSGAVNTVAGGKLDAASISMNGSAAGDINVGALVPDALKETLSGLGVDAVLNADVNTNIVTGNAELNATGNVALNATANVVTGSSVTAGNNVALNGSVSVVTDSDIVAVGGNISINGGGNDANVSVVTNSNFSAENGQVNITNTNLVMEGGSVVAGKGLHVTNATAALSSVEVMGSISFDSDSVVTIDTMTASGSIENSGSLSLKDAMVCGSTVYNTGKLEVTGSMTLQSTTLVYTAESLTLNTTAISLNGGVLSTMGMFAMADATDAIAGVNFLISSEQLSGEPEAFKLVLFENASQSDFEKMLASIQSREVSITLSDLNSAAIVTDVLVGYEDGNIVVTGNASIPEPTTATLSLLALAALAARRRRK